MLAELSSPTSCHGCDPGPNPIGGSGFEKYSRFTVSNLRQNHGENPEVRTKMRFTAEKNCPVRWNGLCSFQPTICDRLLTSKEREIMMLISKLKVRQALTGLVMIVALVSGCQSMTGSTAGQNVDDSTITASVKTKLASEKLSTLTRVEVDTVRAVVSLNGMVESSETRSRVEALVRQVDGVKGVNNNLQVQKK
ncbi:MAG: BON domain-containing protein [Candidatus Binatia bacterium]